MALQCLKQVFVNIDTDCIVLLQASDAQRQLDALQQVLQQLEGQVRQMETERSELEIKAKEALAERDVARQGLAAQVNRVSEKPFYYVDLR